MSYPELEKKLVEAMRRASTTLPQDVISALKHAKKEEMGLAKVQLKAILENIKVAGEEATPMCQDTGIQTFFVKVGYDFPNRSRLGEVIQNAVITATEEIPLRPNTVDPFTGENPGNNTGRFIPYINWELVGGTQAQIILLPKGGGSENMSALNMMTPGEGIEGIKRWVVDHVVNCKGLPCPPTVIGVGIGGGADLALKLAKKSILRPVGERHPQPQVAELEEELFELINQSGVGPMGVGGKSTTLDVHIEYAHRHPASLPVGILVQCWANRRARVTIDQDGSIEVS